MDKSNRVEELVAVRKAAEKAVLDMPDGELKVRAFELAFKDLLEGGNTPPMPTLKPKRGRRSKAGGKRIPGVSRKRSGPKAHISELKIRGFFKEPKDVPEVLKELLKRGHKYSDSEASTTLIRLTREDNLQRKEEKPEKGRTRWVYFE